MSEDTYLGGISLDPTNRCIYRLSHDISQFTCELQLSISWEFGGFNQQTLPPNGGISKTNGYSWLCNPFFKLMGIFFVSKCFFNNI